MKAAIYARVSTTRQADNDLSIPDQVNQLRAWAASNGYIIVEEYIELGASGTDDKRPVFQDMINDASQKPKKFDVILIHSLSRFFRNVIEFGVYEQRLNKNKVKVISITQLTTDDSSGEMMRIVFSTFDQYNSKENSKHTSRAMKQNALQGYFNGSKPPYGYDSISTEVNGSHGRKKKKLAINPNEAQIVTMVYEAYLYGIEGKQMGCKEIAIHLNQMGMRMRGNDFTMQKIHKILSDTLYNGEYHFNVIDSKTGEKRPPEEWIKTTIPAIIDASMFESVRHKRHARSPDQVPASRLVSKTLLTGLLRCGECNHFMTLVTGKSGRYRYYKCGNRCAKGNAACSSKNLSMESTNDLVLNELADKVFAPERLQTLVTEFRVRMSQSESDQQIKLNHLNNEIKKVEARQLRLLEAIEKGVAPLDELTQNRLQEHSRSKEALIIERSKLNGKPAFEMQALRASQIEVLSKQLKQKLLSADHDIAKGYLNLLLDEVRVNPNTINLKGSYEALMAIANCTDKKIGTLYKVPTSIPYWCARSDSNARPFGS